MGVNLVVENSATQEMTAAVSTQAVLNQAEQLKEESIADKKAGKADKKSQIRSLLNPKNKNKAGLELVSNLISDLNSSGLKVNNANVLVQNNTAKEKGGLFGDQEVKEDTVEIRDTVQRLTRQKDDQNRRQQSLNPEKQLVLDEEATETANLYAQTYANYLAHPSSEAEVKRKLAKMENLLEEKGFTPKDLLSFQNKVARSVRQEVSKQIKDAFLKRFFSKEKSIEWVVNNRNLQSTLDDAFFNHKIGGPDFGGENGDLQATANRIADEAREDVRSYVRDEMDKMLVEKHLKGPDAEKAKEMFKLGLKAGLDIDSLLNTWAKKQEDLGLTPFVPPQNSMLGAGMSGQGSNQQNQESVFDEEDKKEIFINSLRHIYMQQAISNDLYSRFKIRLKMAKHKNQMIKLNIQFEEKQIKEEGKALARIKLLKMLKEFYLERSAYYQLSGPAYKLTERKIKSTLSNLERLGFALSEFEQKILIDKTNLIVRDQVIAELNEIDYALKLHDHPGFKRKRPLLMKILARIEAETKVNTPANDAKIVEYLHRGQNDLRIIAEAA